jgi:anti-sigma factor RsiW
MSDYLDIHALADGELSGEDLLRAKERIANDPAAKAEFETVQLLKTAVGTKTAPIEFGQAWRASLARLDELDQRKRVEGFVSRYAWGMCASVFMFIVGMGLYNRQLGGQVGTGDVAKIMSGLSPLSRPVTEPQDMSAWIRPTNRVTVKSFAEGIDQFGRQVTALGIEDAAGPMTLVIVKGADRVSGVEPMVGHASVYAGRIGDANCLMWTQSGLSYTLIGPRSHEDLSSVAANLQGG